MSKRNDGELLGLFVEGGDEAAFAELVARHGNMVHGVSLRILQDHHQAQDVAQAVFLVLARKARRLRREASIAGWLHTVAWRLALNMHKARTRRAKREEIAMAENETAGREELDIASFKVELDAAIEQLPERYRRPLILFHLEGYSLEQTAAALKLKPSTAGTQLARGREILRRKLIGRGLAFGSLAALLTMLSAEAGTADLPVEFVTTTTRAAALVATGKITTGVVSPHVVALMNGALKMMIRKSMKRALLYAGICGIALAAPIALALNSPGDAQKPSSTESAQTFAQPKKNKKPSLEARIQTVLTAWLDAIDKGDLAAYQACLTKKARKDPEYGTDEALKLWKNQIKDLQKQGFKNTWQIGPAPRSAEYPDYSMVASPVVKGKALSKNIIIIYEDGGWRIASLF